MSAALSVLQLGALDFTGGEKRPGLRMVELRSAAHVEREEAHEAAHHAPAAGPMHARDLPSALDITRDVVRLDEAFEREFGEVIKAAGFSFVDFVHMFNPGAGGRAGQSGKDRPQTLARKGAA